MKDSENDQKYPEGSAEFTTQMQLDARILSTAMNHAFKHWIELNGVRFCLYDGMVKFSVVNSTTEPIELWFELYDDDCWMWRVLVDTANEKGAWWGFTPTEALQKAFRHLNQRVPDSVALLRKAIYHQGP